MEKVILCVDDNQDTCELIALVFGQDGYEITSCNSSTEGLECARRGGFAAIIMDYHLEGMSGNELCRKIREFDQRTPIIFFSAEAREKQQVAALASGGQAYVTKPADLDYLKETVMGLIHSSQNLN